MAEVMSTGREVGSLPKHAVLRSTNAADLPALLANRYKLHVEETQSAATTVAAVAAGQIGGAAFGAPFELNKPSGEPVKLDVEANRAAYRTAQALRNQAINRYNRADHLETLAVRHALNQLRQQAAANPGQPAMMSLNQSAQAGEYNRAANATAARLRAEAAQLNRQADMLMEVSNTEPREGTKFLTWSKSGITGKVGQVAVGLGPLGAVVSFARANHAVDAQDEAIVNLQLLAGVPFKDTLSPTSPLSGAAFATRRTAQLISVAVANQEMAALGITHLPPNPSLEGIPTRPPALVADNQADVLADIKDRLGGLPPQLGGDGAIVLVDMSGEPALRKNHVLMQDGVDP